MKNRIHDKGYYFYKKIPKAVDILIEKTKKVDIIVTEKPIENRYFDCKSSKKRKVLS